MKIAPVSAALAALIAAGSVATPTLAQDYPAYGDAPYACHEAKQDGSASGGVIGAIAGALLGSSLAAHSGGRAGGAAIGAVAGAVVGSNIGRSSAASSQACSGYIAYRGPAYGYARAPGYVRYYGSYGYDHARRYDADYYRWER